ncbi:hypothetical protein D3C86_2142640 [compost metagenome]
MGAANECLQIVDLGTLHRGKLAEFEDPFALHHLDHLLRVADVAGQFTVPLEPEHFDKG